MDEIGRKHPPHFPAIERHNTPVIVFVTVCTKDRKPILANDDVHRLLIKAWRTEPSWLVGRYVIMPDHIHLFCAPAQFPPSRLNNWMAFWKSAATRSWPRPDQRPVWQRHFWDTQLRRGDSYGEKWQYVVQNPVRAGLAVRAENWSFQGEVNVLRW